jgi:S1-C subfamily serine protease
VIVAVDGKIVDDLETLLTLLRGDRIPRDATLTVLRGGKVQELAVTVRERERR